MSIPKPKNLYIEEKEMSFADRLKLARKMIEQSTQPTEQESIPEPQPTPPKEEKPKIEPPKWGKPEGWNKKRRRTPFIKVFWFGITRRMDMDAKDHRRYDRFMDTVFPGILIAVAGLVLIGGYIFFTKKDSHDTRGNSYIDKTINYIINKYDALVGYSKKDPFDTIRIQPPTTIDTTVQYVDTVITTPKLSTDNIKIPTDDTSNLLDMIFKQPKPIIITQDTPVVVKAAPKPTKLIIPTRPPDEDNTKLKLSRYIRTLPQFVDNFGGDDWSRLSQDEDDEYKWTLTRVNGTTYHFQYDTTTHEFKMKN